MPSIRLRFAMAIVAMVAPILLAGAIAAPMAFASDRCTDPSTDNDVEYAGDVDNWCTDPAATPQPSPATTPQPSPATTPQPSPTALPQPSPTPSYGPTPSPLPSSPTPYVSGSFPVAYFAPDLTGPATRQFTNQFIDQIGSYVETTYPAGSSAPSSGVPGGAQARLPMAAGPVDEATLTYQLRFPVGTQWVKGGKLPGLCGGACWTGSNNGPGGWAGRFMWRAGGAGEVLLNDATTTGYGSDLGLGSWYFQADGQWHILSEHVRMNTPGMPDGFIDVTYDGVLVAHLTGITFRTDSATHIDSLMFSTFYGGHDSTWAPTTVQHFDFAAFHVTA
ncbi:hypothetical protein EPN29_04525 [bacterium]|nr:MAG: hypothetical protein EPN29_04525 [bacterium]